MVELAINMCHPVFGLPKSFYADVLNELPLALHGASSYSLVVCCSSPWKFTYMLWETLRFAFSFIDL